MKVLLVEDHQLAAKIADFILRSLDCQVDIAKNGEQALEKVKDGQYDLIFMDLGLPGKNGCEVTRLIRLDDDKVPVYALTAHTDQNHIDQAMEAGMNGFLIKPLEVSQVEEVLASAQAI